MRSWTLALVVALVATLSLSACAGAPAPDPTASASPSADAHGEDGAHPEDTPGDDAGHAEPTWSFDTCPTELVGAVRAGIAGQLGVNLPEVVVSADLTVDPLLPDDVVALLDSGCAFQVAGATGNAFTIHTVLVAPHGDVAAFEAAFTDDGWRQSYPDIEPWAWHSGGDFATVDLHEVGGPGAPLGLAVWEEHLEPGDVVVIPVTLP